MTTLTQHDFTLEPDDIERLANLNGPFDEHLRQIELRLGVEIARSYHQRRDYPAMLHWLETAYATSADSVRYSPTGRQMTADAVDHGGPLISRRARSLAGSVGLPL